MRPLKLHILKLVLLFAYKLVHIHSEELINENSISYKNGSVKNFDTDIPDPSDLLADIHEPNPDISYIHQVSSSFLRLTKHIISQRPRSSDGYQVNISTTLNSLRQLNYEDLVELLREEGIAIPHTPAIKCPPYTAAYRTMDGSCNNLANPCWGKTEEPYQRWLPPDYADGVNEPRRRADGQPLPGPRMVYRWVSGDFNPTDESQNTKLTTLLTTFGQFLSHEIVMTPTVKTKVWNGHEIVEKNLMCCNSTTVHPDCLPMTMTSGDAFYSEGHCMEFVRSAAYAHRASSCYPPSLGQHREQINQLTAFIDASSVYGSSYDLMGKLRDHGSRGAKLQMSYVSGLGYPPRRSNSTCKTTIDTCDKRCHLVGERRSNENPALAALHMVFSRQHNRLVDAFRHRGWDEETLFHVVRKIIGAQMQHIVYNEYIPAILGERISQALNLSVPTPFYRYEPHTNPTLYNVFISAAFRYGHSMVNTQQKRRGRDLTGTPMLSRDFFSMDDFCETSSDPVSRLLGGQAEQYAQKVDCIFSKELTNRLFAKSEDGFGMDLFSINIQRGRDHGIPPYNKWREACGLKKAKNFNDLRNEIPNYVVDRLEAIYGADRVDDVDLFVAGVSEFPVNDGILGPTFTCIVANQFRNLKFGDRFWYENTNHPGAFTQDQIIEIRKTTLASLICGNSDLEEIQPKAFLSESLENRKTDCRNIIKNTKLNLFVWG